MDKIKVTVRNFAHMTPPLLPTSGWAWPRLLARPGRRALVVAWLLLVGVTIWGAGRFVADQALADIRRSAEVAAELHAAVLRSELEKHRSLPFVLADDAEVSQALISGEPERLAALNRKLEELSHRTRAAVIYVLDDSGRAVAASNWRLPTSFVGSDYAFRPYFTEASSQGVAEYFSLGAVSRRPGLFLSRSVVRNGRLHGVVVVKVEFHDLETEWRRSGEPAFVVNEQGVVLVTNISPWRFGVIGPVSDQRRGELARALQMPADDFHSLPLRSSSAPDAVMTRLPGSDQAHRYIRAVTPTSTPGWTLHLLEPMDPILSNSVAAARTLALMTGLLSGLGLGLVLYRRDRALAKTQAREAAHAELERRVAARTTELRSANERLITEMDERRRAESDLHLLRDELVQANKLAVLGQIAAGVAHEINQPVAAIRTYAESADTLLERNQTPAARQNMSLITRMTERIGAITDELRAFARKSTGDVRTIPVKKALDGALLLIGPRARQQGVEITVEGDVETVKVLGDQIRLEQVLVNILQNALEALRDRPRPAVHVLIDEAADRIRIIVRDNGPGAAPDIRDQLFTPFVTSKPDGLGLGLVISRDIITSFGGELTLDDSFTNGAAFVLTLRRA